MVNPANEILKPLSSLKWLIMVSVIIYIVFSPFYLWGSLTIGDIWLGFVLFLVPLSYQLSMSLVHFWKTKYFSLSLFLSIAMLSTIFIVPSPLNNSKFIVQFMFIVWILIPLISIGIFQMNSPLLFLEVCSWIYLTIFTIGVILYFGLGLDWVLSNSGNRRFHLWFNSNALQMVTLCLSTAYIFKGTKFCWRYIVMLLGAIAVFIFNASRTGFLTIIFVVGIAALMSLRKPRTFILSIIIGYGIFYLLFSAVIQNKLGIAVRTDFLRDDVRLDSIYVAWQVLTHDWTNWLFGIGWGNSGDGTRFNIVVHNILLQVLTESGIFTLLILCCWLSLPLIWVWKLKQFDGIERTFVILGSVAVWIFLLFNSLSCERIYWLGFAILVGMGYRLRVFSKLSQSTPRNKITV